MKKIIYLSGLLMILVWCQILFANIQPQTNTKIFCGHDIEMDRFAKGLRPARPWSGIGPKRINSTHFRIHFDTTGTHATTRAYAESTSVYAETSWARASRLGWLMPPPDNVRGGDSRYDIYIINLTSYAGVCIEDSVYTNPYPDGYSSWVEIERTFSSWNWLRLLVAHEFHHSNQKRYSQFEDDPQRYFYENTSVYMEHIIFPDTNSLPGLLQQNPSHLTTPHWAITVRSSPYHYSGGLWSWFLQDYYDATLCRPMIRIWNLCGLHAGSHTRQDTDSVLRVYYDSDFQTAVGHYAVWRYYTDYRDDGQHFSEGSTYPLVTILRTHNTYPASGNQGTSEPSGPGGCNFIRFTNLGDNRITLYFNGLNGYEWAAYVIGRTGNWSMEFKIPLEPGQDTGRITIPGWDFSEIVLVPVVTQWTGTSNDLTYSYSVTQSPHLDRPADDITSKEERILFPMLLIKPNPFNSQTTISYWLPKESDKSSLEIYDVSGKLVTSHQPQITNNCFVWDGRDMNEREVKNGIYFCSLKSDNKIINKRITVLR